MAVALRAAAALTVFVNGIYIMVLTVSIFMPMGIDPICFGVFLVPVGERTQIRPQEGFDLFVLQKITGRAILTLADLLGPSGPSGRTALQFPQITLWLPERC